MPLPRTAEFTTKLVVQCERSQPGSTRYQVQQKSCQSGLCTPIQVVKGSGLASVNCRDAKDRAL
jgi:hypothetical protein